MSYNLKLEGEKDLAATEMGVLKFNTRFVFAFAEKEGVLILLLCMWKNSKLYEGGVESSRSGCYCNKLNYKI